MLWIFCVFAGASERASTEQALAHALALICRCFGCTLDYIIHDPIQNMHKRRTNYNLHLSAFAGASGRRAICLLGLLGTRRRQFCVWRNFSTESVSERATTCATWRRLSVLYTSADRFSFPRLTLRGASASSKQKPTPHRHHSCYGPRARITRIPPSSHPHPQPASNFTHPLCYINVE